MEPTPSPAPAPRPFAPERVAAEPGCGRPLLIGCGILAVLLGIAAIAFVFKAKDLVTSAMSVLKKEIVTALPADATTEDKARLEAAFDKASVAVRNGKANPSALADLQPKLMRVSQKISDKSLSRQDVLDLIQSLEALAGEAPPGAPPKPASEAPAGPAPEAPAKPAPSPGG